MTSLSPHCLSFIKVTLSGTCSTNSTFFTAFFFFFSFLFWVAPRLSLFLFLFGVFFFFYFFFFFGLYSPPFERPFEIRHPPFPPTPSSPVTDSPMPLTLDQFSPFSLAIEFQEPPHGAHRPQFIGQPLDPLVTTFPAIIRFIEIFSIIPRHPVFNSGLTISFFSSLFHASIPSH